jgi:spore coat protein U-like protein
MGRTLKTFLLVLLFIFFGVFKGEVAFSQCTMNSTPIHFGNYDTFSSAPLDAIGTITVDCSGNVRRANVTLSVSSTSGTFKPRRMKRSLRNDLLDYNVYTDAARTAIFGDGTGGTSRVRPSRPPGPRVRWNASITMYGRIPPGQDVSAGTYADTLTATVEPEVREEGYKGRVSAGYSLCLESIERSFTSILPE